MSAHKAIPSFKWAESEEKLYVTIELTDAVEVDIKLESNHFHFSSKKKGDAATVYELDFDLCQSINVEASSYATRARQIEVVLAKAPDNQSYWHSLLKDKNQYKGRLKIDWDLWRDEEEELEKPIPNDFGMGGMGGMGGEGGFPGMGGGAGGGMDMASMMAQMQARGGGAGGMPDFGAMGGDEEEGTADSDDEEIPGLSAEEEKKDA